MQRKNAQHEYACPMIFKSNEYKLVRRNMVKPKIYIYFHRYLRTSGKKKKKV